MQVLEVETVSVAANHITMRRAGWLDLDDLGTPVSQLAHRGRASAMGCEVENAEMCEGKLFMAVTCPGSWACASP